MPTQGHEQDVTLTAVACSGERGWEFELNSGLGLRSLFEREEKRPRTCSWKTRVMSVSCR